MNLQLQRNCPKCNISINYTNKSNYNRGCKSNVLCYSCANETRKGRKRTPEQCKLISEKTKIVMETPLIKEKIKKGMGLPEVKEIRSKNTKIQMRLLKEDIEKYNKWKKKHSDVKNLYWNSLTEDKKEIHLSSLKNARTIRWNKTNSRNHMSFLMKGKNNPFYGKKHSQETIEKLRKATTDNLIKFWNNGKLNGINTKPEREVQDILKNNNIEFTTQYVLNNKIFDLYLPKYNLLIEVDGCYWHSKGILPENMNKQQLRRWNNDRFKDKLASENNYKFMRIWEDEINEINVMKGLL